MIIKKIIDDNKEEVLDVKNIDNKDCEKCEFNVIISEKSKELNAEELLDILKSEDGWNKIVDMLEFENYKINNIDINKIVDTEMLVETNSNYATKGLKSVLKHIDTKNITKKLLSELFILEGNDSEYMEILKSIVESTDIHKDMIFYDYEDNNYSQDTSVKLILENSNISRENLYPAYMTSMFKNETFNPIFLTNLTGFYDKEDYKNVEYTVVFY